MKSMLLRLLLVSCIFISVSVKAQAPKPGLLWEISGNGLKQPSFLFGTYHLVGKNFLDTLPEVINKLRLVKSVVGEVIMEDEISMAQKLMPMMMLKDNSLDKILSEKEFAQADSFVKAKSPMNLAMLNGMKPAAVQIMLIALLLPKDVTPENPALDMYFQTEAKKLNKTVVGLETLEEQGTLLFEAPMPRQKELLMKTVRETDRMLKEGQALFNQYKSQDLAAIEKSFANNQDYTMEEMDELLDKRNKTWISRMPELMKAGPVFFAVGAGHLVGDSGLIALIKKAGYNIKPLSLR